MIFPIQSRHTVSANEDIYPDNNLFTTKWSDMLLYFLITIKGLDALSFNPCFNGRSSTVNYINGECTKTSFNPRSRTGSDQPA